MKENYQKGNDALWRAKQAAARAGMGQSTWWALVAQGIAPKPIKIGRRFTAWRASDVLEFIEQAAAGVFEHGSIFMRQEMNKPCRKSEEKAPMGSAML